jgi:hypothetical protein
LRGQKPTLQSDKALFEAVQQKLSTHQPHKTLTRQKADHLLRDLLFDDAGLTLTLDLRPRLTTGGLESALDMPRRDIIG